MQGFVNVLHIFIETGSNAVLPDGRRGYSAAGDCTAGFWGYKAKCVGEIVSML